MITSSCLFKHWRAWWVSEWLRTACASKPQIPPARLATTTPKTSTVGRLRVRFKLILHLKRYYCFVCFAYVLWMRECMNVWQPQRRSEWTCYVAYHICERYPPCHANTTRGTPSMRTSSKNAQTCRKCAAVNYASERYEKLYTSQERNVCSDVQMKKSFVIVMRVSHSNAYLCPFMCGRLGVCMCLICQVLCAVVWYYNAPCVIESVM